MAENFSMIFTDGALGASPAGPGRALLLVGPCSSGAENVVHVFESPRDVPGVLGYGPLAEMAAYALTVGARGVTAKPVGCIRVPNASVTAGTVTTGAVVRGEPGSPSSGTMTLAGTPTDRFDIRVRITRAGGLGAAALRYSLDGAATESNEILIPSADPLALFATGLALSFTGSFEVGDTFAWSTTGPTFSSAAAVSALDALESDSRAWPLVMIVGEPTGVDDATRATNAASLVQDLHTHLELFTAQGRYMRGLVEGPRFVTSESSLSTALASALTPVSAKRVGISGGHCMVPSQINPRKMRVSIAWPYAARAASVPFSQDPGDGGLGPLEGVIAGSLETNATDRARYEGARMFCLQPISGLNGYYVANSSMLAPVGSDYAELPNGRVIDEASRAARAKLLTYRRARIRVAKVGSPNAGRIDDRDAQRIETAVRSAVARAILDTSDAVDVQVVVNRTDNLLATNTLRLRVRVTPYAYAKSIEVEIGLENPALVGE